MMFLNSKLKFVSHGQCAEPFESGAEFEAPEPVFPSRADAEQCQMQRGIHRARTAVVSAHVEIGRVVVIVGEVVVRHRAGESGQPDRQFGIERDVRAVEPGEPYFRQYAEGMVSTVADARHGLVNILDFKVFVVDVFAWRPIQSHLVARKW